MSLLSGLGTSLVIVSIFLFLALMAELCYLLFYKKAERDDETPKADLKSISFDKLLCFKQQQQQCQIGVDGDGQQVMAGLKSPGGPVAHGGAGEDDTVEAELMRMYGLAGPPRLLFTIKEETNEDLESDDGAAVRSRSKTSLSELFHCVETPTPASPFLTPQPSPSSPLLMSPSPRGSYKRLGFNPLFESSTSPPPKFQFLADAEEKFHRALTDEAARARRAHQGVGGVAGQQEHDDASFITIVVGKNKVTPLPSPTSKVESTKSPPPSDC